MLRAATVFQPLDRIADEPGGLCLDIAGIRSAKMCEQAHRLGYKNRRYEAVDHPQDYHKR